MKSSIMFIAFFLVLITFVHGIPNFRGGELKSLAREFASLAKDQVGQKVNEFGRELKNNAREDIDEMFDLIIAEVMDLVTETFSSYFKYIIFVGTAIVFLQFIVIFLLLRRDRDVRKKMF